MAFTIVDANNSTNTRVWVPNPTTRGTWAIYQSCIFTIILCIWQAIHLNIPPPGEAPWKQNFRKIGWAVVALLAPEAVAANAWFQYRDANELMHAVNKAKGNPAPLSLQQRIMRGHVLAAFAWWLLLPVRWLDHARMRLYHHDEQRDWAQKRATIDVESQKTCRQPWTMAVAYFATSGGITANELLVPGVASDGLLKYLCYHAPDAIPDLSEIQVKDQSKANGLAKFLTCLQALWFCTQCATRVGQGYAVSLLEINTFAHCLSALVVFSLWWDKPYDVGSHVDLGSIPYLEHQLERFKDSLRAWLDESEQAWIPAGQFFFASKRPFRTRVYEYVVCKTPLEDDWREPHGDNTYRKVEPRDQKPWYSSNVLSFRLSPHVKRLDTKAGTKIHTIWKAFDRCPDTYAAVLNVLCRTVPAVENFRIDISLLSLGELDVLPLIALTLALTLYGMVHLLAWHYHFATEPESLLWKASAGCTVGFGVVFGLAGVLMKLWSAYSSANRLRSSTKQKVLVIVSMTLRWLVILHVIARAILIVESFIALTNSPASVYEVPTWTAYLPHIT